MDRVTNMKNSHHAKVTALFGATGLLGASVWHLVSVVHLPGFMFSPLQWPSFPFAAILALTIWGASQSGLLPFRPSSLAYRGWISGLAIALSYPIAMLFMGALVFAETINSPRDSGKPDPPPLTAFEALRSELAIPMVLLIGGVLVVCLTAFAVRLILRAWPRRVWAWAFTVPLVVFFLTIAAGKLLSYLYPESVNQSTSDPGGLLLNESAGRGPLLLVIGQPILSALVGHWLCVSPRTVVPESGPQPLENNS
jgi:hypothetical protein